jgi:hypothetical protein
MLASWSSATDAERQDFALITCATGNPKHGGNEPIVDPGNVLEVFANDIAAVTQFDAVTRLLFTLRR